MVVGQKDSCTGHDSETGAGIVVAAPAGVEEEDYGLKSRKPCGRRSEKLLSYFGVYQIGDVYARSSVVIGTSGPILIPNRFAS